MISKLGTTFNTPAAILEHRNSSGKGGTDMQTMLDRLRAWKNLSRAPIAITLFVSAGLALALLFSLAVGSVAEGSSLLLPVPVRASTPHAVASVGTPTA